MDNNTKILFMIQERLNNGAKQYGEFVPIDGSRDNLKEALDEILDLTVYLASVILELHEKYKKFEKEDNPPDKLPF